MSTNEFLDRFRRQLTDKVGPGLEALGNDVRQQVDAAARATFERMDLVTREEFDAQKAVLLRTRERLERLEREMAALEQRLAETQEKE